MSVIESGNGMSRWTVPSVDSKVWSPMTTQLTLDLNGVLTLRKTHDAGKPHVCSFRKLSADPGPLEPRVLPYSF